MRAPIVTGDLATRVGRASRTRAGRASPTSNTVRQRNLERVGFLAARGQAVWTDVAAR